MDLPQLIQEDLTACQSAKDAWQAAQTKADADDAACAAACAQSQASDAARDAAMQADREALDKLEADLEDYFAKLSSVQPAPVGK